VACGKGRNEVWEGDEGVSSTPLPPALHVPIVTHSKGHGEVKSLFDEKAMQTKRKAKTPPKFMLSALDARVRSTKNLTYYMHMCCCVGSHNRRSWTMEHSFRSLVESILKSSTTPTPVHIW
jgi:hypothetical protein